LDSNLKPPFKKIINIFRKRTVLNQKWASTEEMPQDLQNSLLGIDLNPYYLW